MHSNQNGQEKERAHQIATQKEDQQRALFWILFLHLQLKSKQHIVCHSLHWHQMQMHWAHWHWDKHWKCANVATIVMGNNLSTLEVLNGCQCAFPMEIPNQSMSDCKSRHNWPADSQQLSSFWLLPFCSIQEPPDNLICWHRTSFVKLKQPIDLKKQAALCFDNWALANTLSQKPVLWCTATALVVNQRGGNNKNLIKQEVHFKINQAFVICIKSRGALNGINTKELPRGGQTDCHFLVVNHLIFIQNCSRTPNSAVPRRQSLEHVDFHDKFHHHLWNRHDKLRSNLCDVAAC